MQNRYVFLRPSLFNVLKNFLNIKTNINKINYLGYIFVKEAIYNVE
jgi:hypothetical protein